MSHFAQFAGKLNRAYVKGITVANLCHLVFFCNVGPVMKIAVANLCYCSPTVSPVVVINQ